MGLGGAIRRIAATLLTVALFGFAMSRTAGAVEDHTPPVVTAPANVTVSNNPNQAGAVVNYPAATASDDSGGAVTLSYSSPSGSFFPLGTTTVTVTGTDPSANTTQASFTVTVVDTQPPSITAPANITISNDPNQAGAVVNYPAFAATDNAPGVTTSVSIPSGSFFPLGTTTVTGTATDGAGNTATASFSVTVNDTQPPSITAPANITVSNDPNQAGATVNYPAFTATDNAPGVAISVSIPSGSFFPIGTTTVTGTATDTAGNTATSSFSVTVNDTQPPTITAPANITVANDAGQAGAVVNYPAPTVSDNAPGVTVTSTPPSGSFFPLGTTTVTSLATDTAGNTATASFTVTVNDTQPPTITAPANITVANDPGQAGAVVNYPAPTASDNAPGVTVTSTPPSGSFFPIGTTTVTGVATDASGNTASASFTITVNDTQGPTITAPANITVSNDPGQAGAVVNYPAPTVSDNAPGATSSCTPPSGTTFPKGATTVTCVATDAANNTASATFTVTVNDTEPPAFATFPSDISATTDYPGTTASVSWPQPTVTDNLPGATVTQTAGPASGSAFPIGKTTITYEARDTSGNTVTRSFSVTVSQSPPGTVVFKFESAENATYRVTSDEPALNLSISTAGGSGSASATVRKGTFGFAYSVPSGVGVTSASCSAGGEIDAQGMRGTLSVTSGGLITCTISTVDSRNVTAGLIGEFLETRSDLILENGPDVARRIERLTGQYTNNGGVSALGFGIDSAQLPFNVTLSDNDAKFSYSLRRSQAEGAATHMTAGAPRADDGSQEPAGQVLGERFGQPGDSGAGGSASGLMTSYVPGTTAKASQSADVGYASPTVNADPMQHRFDVWAEGRLMKFDSQGGDGQFGIVHAGMDYLFTPSILGGIGVQVDWTSEDGNAGGSISGTGYMVGPYMTARLSQNFYFDARAAWGQAFNEVSPFGTYNDKFDSERWLATAAIVGQYDLGNAWSVRPELRLSWYKENSDPYTDSLNVSIPSISVETGTLKFGPTFTKKIELQNGFVLAPFITLDGIWTFHQDNTATTISNQPGLQNEGLRGKVDVGTTISSASGISISGALSYDGIGSNDLEAWGGRLRIGQKF